MNEIDQLANKLIPHYSHFNVDQRLLFTGHSHQAWPDVALEGLQEAYQSAASNVDTKWKHAFEKTEILRGYLRDYYDDPQGLYCRGESTHQLLVAWLSSLNLKENPKVVTTDSEFHSMFRQLHRLKEEGLQVKKVQAHAADIVSQIAQAIDPTVAAILLSRVYFESGIVNQHLSEIAELARRHHIPLLIDDYHGTNVVPLSLKKAGLEDCFFLIGGYKYLEWGEGNCFLRYPESCELRPAITGWFAAFNSLEEPRTEGLTSYDEGNQRFASGTYDSTSQFRAAKVVQFFREHQLTPQVLRNHYLNQIALLKKSFLEEKLDSSIIKLRHNLPLDYNGGFLALQSPFAQTIRTKLLKKDIFTDARGDILRLGPAPYVTSRQLRKVIQELAKTVGQLNS